MSASAEKATRRDLRRAVGEEAVGVIEMHEQGLRSHALSLKRHDRLITDVIEAGKALEAKVAALEAGTWSARLGRLGQRAHGWYQQIRGSF